MDNDFSPLETINLILRKWWLLALMLAVGGLVGILFFQMRQPIYEATVSFAMGIDYTRTGPITQYDEDHALGMAGALITSSRIKEKVVEKAAYRGIDIGFDQLHTNAFLERKAHVWILRIQHENPETAAQLANIWAEIASNRLEEAYQHALKKESLERYAISLSDCLQMSVASGPVLATCQVISVEELQEMIAQLNDKILAEKQASYNIFPGLLFGEVTQAVVPQKPVRYGRGSIVLAGMSIGLIAGIFLIHTPLNRQNRKG